MIRTSAIEWPTKHRPKCVWTIFWILQSDWLWWFFFLNLIARKVMSITSNNNAIDHHLQRKMIAYIGICHWLTRESLNVVYFLMIIVRDHQFLRIYFSLILNSSQTFHFHLVWKRNFINSKHVIIYARSPQLTGQFDLCHLLISQLLTKRSRVINRKMN